MTRTEAVERIIRVAAIATFLVIAWLCLGGESWFAVQTPIAGFLVHLIIFFFLAAVAYVGWANMASKIALGMLVLAVVIQIVLPGRTFSTLDLAGNLIGVGLAWVFFRVLLNFNRTIRV